MLFKRYIIPGIMAVGAVLMTACGHESVAQQLDSAEQALNENDPATARTICDAVSGDGGESLSVADLCRLSIIYMKLSDVIDQDVNTASATQCFDRAIKLNSDSAIAFFNNLPIDEARHVELMMQLSGAIGSELSIEEFSDSLGYYIEMNDSLAGGDMAQ